MKGQKSLDRFLHQWHPIDGFVEICGRSGSCESRMPSSPLVSTDFLAKISSIGPTSDRFAKKRTSRSVATANRRCRQNILSYPRGWSWDHFDETGDFLVRALLPPHCVSVCRYYDAREYFSARQFRGLTHRIAFSRVREIEPQRRICD